MKFNKHISDPAEEHSSALISRALLFIGVCRLLVDPLCVFHPRPFIFFLVLQRWLDHRHPVYGRIWCMCRCTLALSLAPQKDKTLTFNARHMS